MAKNKRAKGTGTIYQRASDGMWVASLELPSEPGKRRRKVIVRAKKGDVVAALRDARKELERTGDLPAAQPTLGVWLDLWLQRSAAKRLKVSTVPSYQSKIETCLKPSIGRIRLDKLTPAHVERMHEYVMVTRGLSSTSALGAHRILAKALTDAVREGRISRNVATLVDAPKKAAVTIPALDGPEARAMLLAQREDEEAAAKWGTALLTGIRQGERLGLMPDYIDLDRKVLTVAWQLKRLRWDHGCAKAPTDGVWPCGRKRGGNCPERHVTIPQDQEARHVDGGLWLLRPKSRAGWREVPICEPLAAILRAYFQTRDPQPGQLIFTRPDGRPIDPKDDSAAWDAALAAAGLPDVTEHSARHTCATLLLEVGVPEAIRIKILGHSSATVTAGYTKVADALTQDAMRQLGELVMPKP
ncbi:tyrosine-type recombinase/integrase [Nocardioides sp. ChNu-99]|uniref:tyrosine-type recombinase/integrase n=1 Tax=Nocardioides sp. ChNu-99 TaxID=2839897 RepID=UPI002406B500|nr:tyrosine-type recombinase/integrase [Nocardioides sp. ChNu-99]MDF9717644.1 site-specific integrase [Nocardioides sp. ChNu-99]